MIRKLFTYQFTLISILILLLASCGGGGSSPSSSDSKASQNPPPTLDGLSFNTSVVGINIDFDVIFSSFDGAGLNIKSKIISAPKTSKMLSQIFQGNSFTTSLDVVGLYTFQVTVSDNFGSVTKDYKITTTNRKPAAEVRSIGNTFAPFSPLTLYSHQIKDLDQQPLTYSWTLLSKPSASKLELNKALGHERNITLTPDIKGKYSIKLEVFDGFGGEDEQIFDFTIGAFKLRELPINGIFDATYNAVLDKIIILSSGQLIYLYSPETHDIETISLPYRGSSLSVLADGSKIAVGHADAISLIDVKTLQVEKIYSVGIDVFDIEISSNGYIYATSSIDQEGAFRAIQISNGEEFPILKNTPYYETIVKLSPDQKYIYTLTPHSTSNSMQKFDIENGLIGQVYNLPSSATYNTCGYLWIPQNSEKIFTGCGNTFALPETRTNDIEFIGKLNTNGQIFSLSKYQNNLVTINEETKNTLSFYSYDNLQITGTEKLPVPQKLPKQSNGLYTFYRKNGSIVTIVRIGDSSSVGEDLRLAYEPTGIEDTNLKPVAILDKNKTVNINEQVEISAESSLDPEGTELSYHWELYNKPNSSKALLSSLNQVTTSFTPDVKGTYQIKLKVNDGNSYSPFATIKIIAEDPKDKQLIKLDYEITASAYSEQLDKVILSAVEPNQLLLFDINDNTIEKIQLSGKSDWLKLSSSQTTALTLVDEGIALIDLIEKKVSKIFKTPSTVSDIMMPGNGYLYVFPSRKVSEPISIININTGEKTEYTPKSTDDIAALAKKSPIGNYAYGLTSRTHSPNIVLYDLSKENVSFINSYSDKSYPVCGNLWISDDANNLLTACGNVFKSNPRQNDDMQFIAKLKIPGEIKSLSQKNDEIAVMNMDPQIPDGDSEIGRMINIYQYPNLSFLQKIEIPSNSDSLNYGDKIYHSSDGQKIISLVTEAEISSKFYKYSLFIYSK